MTNREEFVDQLLSSLPVDEYCLRIVNENEKFSKMAPEEKQEAILNYKGSKKDINFQNAIKKQWRKYFLSAYDCGLFQEEYEDEILKRIIGLERELKKDRTEDFRGALAVCCASYVLNELFGIEVKPHLRSYKKRSYDLDIYKDNWHFTVEVKAPEKELQHPPGQLFHGNDSEYLINIMHKSKSQDYDFFCIVCNLTTQIGQHGIYYDRERLINAVCTNYIYPEFKQEFSEIKAILSIEQRLLIVGDGEYDHSLDILLMENPRYYDEIAPIVGSECVHLIKKEDEWFWSDGKVYGFKLADNKS